MQMNKGNFQYFFVWFGFGYHLSLNLLNSTEENSEVFSSCLLFKSLKLLFWSDAVMILLQTWCLEIHQGITAICLRLLYIFFLQVVFGCNCVCVGVRICPCLVVLLLIFRPCLCYWLIVMSSPKLSNLLHSCLTFTLILLTLTILILLPWNYHFNVFMFIINQISSFSIIINFIAHSSVFCWWKYVALSFSHWLLLLKGERLQFSSLRPDSKSVGISTYLTIVLKYLFVLFLWP